VYLVTIVLVWQRPSLLTIAFLKYLYLDEGTEEILCSLSPLGLVCYSFSPHPPSALRHLHTHPSDKMNHSPQVKGLDLSSKEIHFQSSYVPSPHKRGDTRVLTEASSQSFPGATLGAAGRSHLQSNATFFMQGDNLTQVFFG